MLTLRLFTLTDMMTEFQSWEDETFWPSLTKQNETKSRSAADNVQIEVSNSRAATLRAGVLEAKVIEAKTLTAPGVPEKRHLEIKLPSSMVSKTLTTAVALCADLNTVRRTVQATMSRCCL